MTSAYRSACSWKRPVCTPSSPSSASMLATICLRASRARSRSTRSRTWCSRVCASSSLTERTPREVSPSSNCLRIASHWPRAQESFSASSTRLAVSSWHRPPSWANRRWWCCSTTSASTHSDSMRATAAGLAPSSHRRRVASASCAARAGLCGSRCGSARTSEAPSCSRPGFQSTPLRSVADRTTGAAAASSAAGAVSTPTDAASSGSPVAALSHAPTSCERRWSSRAESLRLPASTRRRLSFLRAAVQCFPPVSMPRAMRSIRVANAMPSATAPPSAGAASGRISPDSSR